MRAHETAAGKQTQVLPQAQENQSLPVRKKVQLVTPALTRSRSIPLCISRLKLLESYVCSRHSTFVRMNEFHSFIVSSDYLLVAEANHGKRLKGGEPVAVLRNALIEPPRQFAIQHLHRCIKRSKVTFYGCQPTRASRRCHHTQYVMTKTRQGD